jgi:CheY-like chemotaxis protein
LADDLWLIEIDSTQFEQVVLNLVVNARDAIAAGGQIVLGTENVTVTETHAYRKDVPTPGDYVGLSVADTGSGIPAEALPKIFEPFFTTKNRAGSSGLGLATVLGIVQTNEGGIHVESKPGRGSRFTALFPRSTRSRVENVPPVAAPTLRLRPADAPAILFVENNPDLRVAVVELLEAAGYRVTAASEPAAALEMFDAARRDGSYFDLLITDIVMPGMSGKRLADRIHEEEPALPVLFLSGQPDDEPSRHEIARDYVPLLRKPFSMERLLDAIEALGEDGASRGPDAQA